MNNNKNKYPLTVLAITLGLLMVLSSLKTDFYFGNYSLRKVNILSDLENKRNLITEIDSQEYSGFNGQIVKDKQHQKDIIQYLDSNEKGGLKVFLKALADLKKGKRKKVRIAYFGDSMIEGDLISQDLRRYLQKQYGGKGVGFVPVMSISAPNRSSVQHTYSGNWKDANFQNSRWGAFPFGFSGHVFYAQAANCWFKLKGVSEERLKDFSGIKIFYGKTDSGQTILVNDTPFMLATRKSCSIDIINFRNPQKQVVLNMGSNINLPFYGASIESDLGLTLDNYSFRGITGIELSEIPVAFFKVINEKYPYDLVILHYGPNLLFKPDIADFSWFERKMDKTLKHLKKNLPNTSFLLIGSADKASFIAGKWTTAIGVIPLIKTQNRLADKYHCAFWNLYENMGGRNSMTVWTDKKPVMANKDHTHFNHKGARKIGNALFESILNQFNAYEKKK